MPVEREIIAFASPADFENWLELHHAQTTGIWIRIAKKGSGQQSINYAQALDCALCYGWIDGQKDKLDENSWLQYFTKRKPKSIWSQINRNHVDRLIQAGRMRPPGQAAIDAAKQSGQWDQAYQSFSSRDTPPELEMALKQNPKAREFFESLNSQNRFAFVFRVQTAKKPETKMQRVSEFIRMLENGEVFYPKK